MIWRMNAMIFLVQRVCYASVKVENSVIGSIDEGLLVFLGIGQNDTKEIADKMVRKLIGLRVFEDDNGKTNLDIKNVKGSLLLVSQFTLCADCKKGNRPSFTNAGSPEFAKGLYEYIIELCKEEIDVVEEGSFGAEMKVELLNNGPFTIILDSDKI